MNSTNVEDLSLWKAYYYILGFFGIVAGFLGLSLATLLSGEHEENLISFINILLGPNAVLIGSALVAITFASNWKVTRKQYKRREELVISSLVLSGLAVLGFLCAGLYVAIAPSPEGTHPIGAKWVEIAGHSAAFLLASCLGGLATMIFRLGMLVRYQTGGIRDDQ